MAKDQSLSHLAYCIFCGSKNHGVNVSINEGNVGMLALKLKKSAAVTVCMECLCKAMPELVGQVPVAFNGTIDELIRTVMPANELKAVYKT